MKKHGIPAWITAAVCLVVLRLVAYSQDGDRPDTAARDSKATEERQIEQTRETERAERVERQRAEEAQTKPEDSANRPKTEPEVRDDRVNNTENRQNTTETEESRSAKADILAQRAAHENSSSSIEPNQASGDAKANDQRTEMSPDAKESAIEARKQQAESPEITAEEMKGKSRTDLRQMAGDKGLDPYGEPDKQDGLTRKWRDPATKSERLRLDRGHNDKETGQPYDDPKAAVDHAHAYDPDGQRVKDDTGNHHFPTTGE